MNEVLIFTEVIVCRIHYVVGNACVKVWATKIISEFQNYLAAGEKGIEGRCTYLADTIAGINFNMNTNTK